MQLTTGINSKKGPFTFITDYMSYYDIDQAKTKNAKKNRMVVTHNTLPVRAKTSPVVRINIPITRNFSRKDTLKDCTFHIDRMTQTVQQTLQQSSEHDQ